VAGEEVGGVEAAVWVFPRLDEAGVLGFAEACFAGVLGPAILLALSWSTSVEENAVSVVVGSKARTRRLDHERCRCGKGPVLPFSGERVYLTANFSGTAFSPSVMHRLARSLVTAAGCSKSTSAATRLAANWQRSAAARSTPTSLPWSTSRRMIHVRVPLPYEVEDGMGDFLSPAALKVVAEDYQQGLLDRLNEQIKGKCLRVFEFHKPMKYLLDADGRV
jgi:hypothetical protein